MVYNFSKDKEGRRYNRILKVKGAKMIAFQCQALSCSMTIILGGHIIIEVKHNS